MLPPYSWSAVVTQWQFAPAVIVPVAILAILYLWGVRRVAARHPARPWPAWRAAMFLGGLAVIVVATLSGIGRYDDILFWDHMIQHLMLIMVAPPLLIAGQPITLLLHASRNPVHTWAKRMVRSRLASLLTWPVFGALAYTVAVMVFHLTSIASTAARDPAVYHLEEVFFLVVGYLFFLPVIGREPIRWRLSYPVRFVILLLIMPVDTFTGLVLGYGNAGTPGVPPGPRPAWAPSAVQDLHLGGAVMWVGGDAIMFALMMLVYLMWSTDDRTAAIGGGWLESARSASFASLVTAHRQATAGPDATSAGPVAAGTAAQDAAAAREPAAGRARHGGIDDDEHLAAYNAYLARLHEAETRGQGQPR